ncbi:MAG: MarR family winged helix-turn-helix transcriptional regulator [Acidimicrobiales bacterium]
MRQVHSKIDVANDDVAVALYTLAAMTVRRMPRDMSLSAVAALHTLERHGPQRLTHLASIEGVTQPTMTVLVTRLERAGLVERRSAPTDRRAVVVALTAAGKRYVRRRRRIGAASLTTLIASLPTDQVAALRGALPAIASLCEAANRDTVTGSAFAPVPAGGAR